MKTFSTWIAGGLVAMLLATSGGAAFYRQRAHRVEAQLARVREEAEVLHQKLVMRQANAADVVLDFSVPGEGPAPVVVAVAGETNGVADAAQAERIRALEVLVQAKDREIARLQERSTNRAAWFQQGRDRQNWMEELKKTDPERYNEMVKQREEQRRQVSAAFAGKAAKLLESSEIPDATEEQTAQRNLMLQLMTDTWKMAEQLYADPPPSDRWETMHAMRDNMNTLQPMLDSERSRTFYQLGLDSGYSESEAQVFVDYVNEVIDTTSLQPLKDSMRRGRGGPPPQSAMPTAGSGAISTKPAGL